jgi:hypothetical protein
MKELENKLKELKEENINVSDLEILEEINYQSEYCLNIKLSEEEKKMAFSQIHRAWLKSEDLTIYQITTTALENLKALKDMTTWELIEKTCWRCY